MSGFLTSAVQHIAIEAEKLAAKMAPLAKDLALKMAVEAAKEAREAVTKLRNAPKNPKN